MTEHLKTCYLGPLLLNSPNLQGSLPNSKGKLMTEKVKS